MPTQTIKRTMAQKRALIAECRRRMEAGEEIKSICAALQINIKTFQSWAKIHGFRRGDVDPGNPRARTTTPPGPRDKTHTGTYLRGEGLPRSNNPKGRAPTLSPEAEAHFLAHPADAWLVAKRAEAMGDHALANAICKLLRRAKTRETDMARLMEIAREDPDYDWGAFGHECMARWDDDELRARVVYQLMYPDHKRYTRPPEAKRPSQAWIDHYKGRQGTPGDLADQGRAEPNPPSPEPYSACHASVNMAANPLGLIPEQRKG